MANIRMSFLVMAMWAVAAFAQQSSEITGWQMQDSATVGSTGGETISTASYTPTGWYTATVPGTVLGTLVDQMVYSDPMYGQNMKNIPDLANQQKRYWFRTTFNATFIAGQRVWVEFGGINYFATIFCNGQLIGTMYGAFKEAKFDITDKAVSGENCLAVKIRGNYYPGAYHTKESGNCGANGGVMSRDGPTFIASQGWDWIPTIPDRDMGIWKPVYVRVTGPVAIRHPWIRTTEVSKTGATVALQITLKNTTASPVSGTLNAGIDDNAVKFESKTVSVPANDTVNVSFTNVTLTNPRLWWPNGYGEPNLYDCRISFTPEGTEVSDTSLFKFGVRHYSFSTGSTLIIKCNGQRILARGGNWGMDDAMKRWDLHKLENRVRYHKEMNFNIIRDWIGMTDNEPFYDLCDRYGQMVWSDFWEPHSADQPVAVDDQANFIANMHDKILRVRNHACLVLWCARNETTPTAAFLTALNNFHTSLDGTRTVIASSGSGGVHSGGPYTYTSPANAYAALTGFHTELGGPTVPSFETVSTFLPTANQMPMGNTWWSFHDYCSGNGDPSKYTSAMATIFGSPSTLKECCTRAQLMNYDDYRAYFEALQVKRFSGATGLLLWMSNCVWPSLMWQTYDYYMEGTGAMYGSQEGSEPVHIMYYGSGSYNVSVVNNTMRAISNYSATGTTYNLDGKEVWTKTATVTINADASNDDALGSAITAGSTTPYFLDLKLKDADGKLISKNFYWLPSSGSDISKMLTMTKATLTMTIAEADWTREGAENTIAFKIANTSTVCAVACRLKLTRQNVDERILPCHYNDNYFSLAPGDTQDVEIKFDEVDRKEGNPKLFVSGINVDEKELTIGGLVPVFHDGVSGRMVRRVTMQLISGKMLMHNLTYGFPWTLFVYDMRGRVVASERGIGSSTPEQVSLAQLRSGIYVAMAYCHGETQRSVVTVTR